MCWFSTTLLNTRNVKGVGYDEVVALRGRCSVKLKQICLRTWYYSINMLPGPLEIKEKNYLTDAPPLDMPTNNVKLYQPRLLHCQYKHICRVERCHVAAAATYMPAGLVLQIHQACLQVRCGSHRFVKLISYHPGRHLEYIKF